MRYSWRCAICWNIVKNFLRHKEVFGNYVEPKSIILMIVLQMVNRLSKRKRKWKTRKRLTWPAQQPENTVASQQIPPLNTSGTIPSKYLSSCWRSLDLPLMSCEVQLDLKWSRNYVLIEEDNHKTGVNFTFLIC